MKHAKRPTRSFLLLAIASLGLGCSTQAETPLKDPASKAPRSVASRVTACPGFAQEETHTLATLSCYEEACNSGDLPGCSLLGTAYLSGKIVARDPKRAVELLQRACDGNDGMGCLGLTAFYLGFTQEGGLAIDAAKALSFGERACELEIGEGCGIAGGLYLGNEGIAQDNARAKTLFQRGCSLGYDKACQGVRKVEAASATR
jgi:hypothetical protein